MTISIDDFKKIQIKIGEIVFAEKVLDSDKLLRLEVDFGEEKPRQIVSGISVYFENPNNLVGKKCAFVTNLEPRTIKGLESQGMILAVSGDSFFSLLNADTGVVPGVEVK